MTSTTDILISDQPITEAAITTAAEDLVQRNTQWRADLRWLIERAVDDGISANRVADILSTSRTRDDHGRPPASRPWVLNIARSHRIEQDVIALLQPKAAQVDDLGDITAPGLYNLCEHILEDYAADLPTVTLTPQATAREAWLRLTVHASAPGRTRPAVRHITATLRGHGYRLEQAEDADTIIVRVGD